MNPALSSSLQLDPLSSASLRSTEKAPDSPKSVAPGELGGVSVAQTKTEEMPLSSVVATIESSDSDDWAMAPFSGETINFVNAEVADKAVRQAVQDKENKKNACAAVANMNDKVKMIQGLVNDYPFMKLTPSLKTASDSLKKASELNSKDLVSKDDLKEIENYSDQVSDDADATAYYLRMQTLSDYKSISTKSGNLYKELGLEPDLMTKLLEPLSNFTDALEKVHAHIKSVGDKVGEFNLGDLENIKKARVALKNATTYLEQAETIKYNLKHGMGERL